MSDLVPKEQLLPQEKDQIRSVDLTVDHLVTGIARIAFNPDSSDALKLKALTELGKHKGMFVERHETRTIDTTQFEAARELFNQMTTEEKYRWLEEHKANIESALRQAPKKKFDKNAPIPVEARPALPDTSKDDEILKELKDG